MDSKWKPGQLHVVGILQLYDADKLRRQILNSVEAPLSYATGAEQIQNSRSVTLFPNPSSDQATLQLKNFGQEDLTLKVINISGQEMTEQVIANPGISKTISLDLRKYPAGLYFVRISGPSGQNHLKLIKQ
jgi:hypothetical protein